MSCGFEERVAAYASGEPDDELAAHLPGCATCRAELDAAHQVLRALGEAVPPARAAERAEGELFFADFARGVRRLHEAEAAAERRGGRRALWIAAPVVLAAAAAVVLWARGPGEPGPRAEAPPVVPVAEQEPAELLALDAPEPGAAFDAVEALPDEALDSVLAGLGGGEEPAEDPMETVDELDDEELDRALEGLQGA